MIELVTYDTILDIYEIESWHRVWVSMDLFVEAAYNIRHNLN